MTSAVPSHRLATFLLAGLLAVAAAALRPANADAGVRFSDGVEMFVQINCDYQGFNTTVFNGSQQVSYARTIIWNHQTGRWLDTASLYNWYAFGNAFSFSGFQRWMYGPGTFTFRSQLGRYVGGVWVLLWEQVDYRCFFAR